MRVTAKMLKKTYKIKGMDCASCATLLEMDLEEAGIKASCSYAKETLEVEFRDQISEEEQVKRIIEKSGFGLG